MLTPAEEMGLGGMYLAGRVLQAFYKLDEKTLIELMQRIRDESLRRHVVYLREGVVETIRLLPCPLPMLSDQLAYLHHVSLTMHNALKRLPELYLQDVAVREVLRIPPEEERWLLECWGPSHQESNPIFGRLDAVVNFHSPMWKDSLKLLEPNLSGIGGLNIVPMCEAIMAEVVFPLLQSYDPALHLEVGQDIRDLLMQEVLDHLDAIGRKAHNLCFVEPKYAASGVDEQEDVARFFHDRHGLKVMHADPAELSIRGEEVYYDGERVDVAYRDYQVTDLLSLEKRGANIEPMRLLFRQNRVVSSIAAELDQKSCWEVLTDPRFSKYFGPEERQVFRRHVLWTRLLHERRTGLPNGQTGDLLPYVREERESLVIKPNRAYGGEGVLIGLSATQAEWDAAMEQALADRERWVVQQVASLPVNEFPVVDDDGKTHLEPFHTVVGFAPTRHGLSILGRASQKQVVNVAQRGGVCVIATGHPPERLVGPAEVTG
jgi:hypothetical protein